MPEFFSGFERGERRDREQVPKKGHTIYVSGKGLTEPLAKKTFSNFGNIVNITIESEKK